MIVNDMCAWADLRGGEASKGHAPAPNLTLNKFEETPSGSSRMQENLLAARALPRTPLGELTAASPAP